MLRVKKGAYKLWKHGHVTWEEYRDAVQTCRRGIRRAKAQAELNLVRDLKNKGRLSTGTFARRDRPKRVYLLW